MTTGTDGPPQGDLIKLGGVPPLRAYLRSAWARREFAISMATGELRSQNFDTVLGNIWHLLNPLLLVGVYYLMFGVILDVSRGMPNFVGFLAVGIFAFMFLQRSATSGASAIVNNVGLIRSLQFPRLLLPASAVLKEALAFGSTLIVMVIVVIGTELQACSAAEPPPECATVSSPITADWLMLLPVFVLMLVFGFGVAFWTARLTDHVRDTANVLPYVFRILFYVSGVLYPVERFVTEPWMQEVFLINPFYGFVTLVRHYIMGTYTSTVVGTLWVYLFVWSLALALTGVLFFRARENRYGRG